MKAISKFSIYGFQAQVESLDPQAHANQLDEDFSYFKVSQLDKTNLVITQKQEFDQPSRKGILIGKTKMCEVRQVSQSVRLLIYSKYNTLVEHIDNPENRTLNIYTDNLDLFFEISSIVILSACGEYLETKGIMRLHAFSCLYKDRTKIFWGPRGAGKSTLSIFLQKNPEVKIYSDEITLIDLKNRTLLPFPIRITLTSNARDLLCLPTLRSRTRVLLDQKHFIDIPSVRVAESKSVQDFYILRSFMDAKNSIQHSPALLLFLFANIVLGLGLIQMAEYMIRPRNLFQLMIIFKNRIHLAWLMLRLKPMSWSRTPNLEENMQFCFENILQSDDCYFSPTT